jgi:hypothetical protein
LKETVRLSRQDGSSKGLFLKINFRHERMRRTVPFCTTEAISARLAEGWQQARTILIRVDPWKATSFSHVAVGLFLQGMRQGRLIA